MLSEKPTYPITVTFHEDGEVWVMKSERDLAFNLEWFDSNDPEERATVIDKYGRRVRLKIEKLELKLLELE